MTRTQIIFAALALGFTTLIGLRAPGTDDVPTWEAWASTAAVVGSVEGFRINPADYPPFTTIILRAAVLAVRPFGLGAFGAVKAAVLVFLLLTTLLFWLWTRQATLALALYAALLLNSIVMGYLDVFMAPSVLLALWALAERRLAWLAVFVTAACFTKWQPLIIVPFLAVYLLSLKEMRWRALLPAAAIALMTVVVFGTVPVARAFVRAFVPYFLSGNALNANWILAHALHVLNPATFGGLVGGEATLIVSDNARLMLPSRVLFALFYLITLTSCARHEKSLERTINAALVGYLAYFTFNPSVHENHLFLATLLSMVLLALNSSHLWLTIAIVVMSNLNLAVFYGLLGTGLGFSRAIAGTIDAALLLSIVNVGSFLKLWADYLRDANNPMKIERSSFLPETRNMVRK